MEHERYTVLLVPEGGDGVPVKQLVVEVRSVRRLVILGGILVGLLLSLGLYGISTLPLNGAHRQLAEENIFLREKLHDIESKLDDADATLERVKLYDAQLRDMVRDSPMAEGKGPLLDDEWLDLDTGLDGLVEEELFEDEEWTHETVLPDDLRPAEAWAVGVAARTDDYVRQLNRMEPRLGLLAEDVEDMLAVQSSFPQTWPIQGARFTSGFGYRRSPVRGRMVFHHGIDLSAPRGTRIFAASNGEVVTAEYSSGYGRMVEIDHGYGITSRYAHCSSLFVRTGDWVESGQVIATVGSTGQTTGPHLHFELLIDGQVVDPMEYLP